MAYLIRLRYDQVKALEFDHPLLNQSDDYKLTEKQFEESDRESRQLSKLWLVRRIVGRYLYHWPITRNWLDDMCSAGLQGLMEIDNLRDDELIMDTIQRRIEETLNDLQSIVRSSLGTNIRRSARGENLEYVSSVSLDNIGREDPEMQQVDELDDLKKEDRKLYDERSS